MMVEGNFHLIESIPILKSNVGGAGDHGRKAGATPATQVIRGVRGRWHPKIKAVSGLMPGYWISIALLFMTLSIVMISTFLTISYLSKQGSTELPHVPVAPDTVFLHYFLNDNEQVPIAKYANYIAYMAENYKNLKFKIFFLKDDIRASYLQLFNIDIWSLMGMTDHSSKNIDQTSLQAYQDLQKNFSNVKIFMRRLSDHVTDKCWQVKMKKIPEDVVPFYVRVYTVWQYGGIALSLETYEELQGSSGTNIKKDRLLEVFKEFNNEGRVNHKVLGFKSFRQLLEEANVINKIFIAHFIPLQVINELSKPDTDVKGNEVAIPPNVRGNGAELREKRSIDIVTQSATTTTALEAEVTEKANKNQELQKLNDQTTSEAIESAKLQSSRQPFFDSTHGNVSRLILALLRSGPFNMNAILEKSEDEIQKQRSIANNIYMDLTGSFVAASLRRHPFLTYILASTPHNNPTQAIKSVLQAKCGGQFQCPFCETLYFF